MSLLGGKSYQIILARSTSKSGNRQRNSFDDEEGVKSSKMNFVDGEMVSWRKSASAVENFAAAEKILVATGIWVHPIKAPYGYSSLCLCH